MLPLTHQHFHAKEFESDWLIGKLTLLALESLFFFGSVVTSHSLVSIMSDVSHSSHKRIPLARRFTTRLAPEMLRNGVFDRTIRQRTGNSLKAIPIFSVFRKQQHGPLEKFDDSKLEIIGEMMR